MVLTSADDRDALRELTSTIDAAILLDLACDVLFVRGHSQIRITDGPGDGARDIHSIDPTGAPFVTQCKYHNDSDAKVRSRETAELPIALIKFNCKNGLFITTANITPQSKREYLNDYPNFSLDFLDGLELVRELRGNTLLRSRWLEGNGLSWPYVVSIPVLVRRHERDTPILPYVVHGESVSRALKEHIERSLEDVNVSVTDGSSGEEDFISYREPQPLTQEEGFFPWMRCTEVKCTSPRSFASIERIQEQVAQGGCSEFCVSLAG